MSIDAGTVRRCWNVVAVVLVEIGKWFDVWRSRMMWSGCVDYELRRWCVISWGDIWMVHRSMNSH